VGKARRRALDFAPAGCISRRQTAFRRMPVAIGPDDRHSPPIAFQTTS